MGKIKIRLEFMVDVEIIKKVLKKRGLDVTIGNIKKVASLYKERQYSIKDEEFFDDFPSDRETLLMYGFKVSQKKCKGE